MRTAIRAFAPLHAGEGALDVSVVAHDDPVEHGGWQPLLTWLLDEHWGGQEAARLGRESLQGAAEEQSVPTDTLDITHVTEATQALVAERAIGLDAYTAEQARTAMIELLTVSMAYECEVKPHLKEAAVTAVDLAFEWLGPEAQWLCSVDPPNPTAPKTLRMRPRMCFTTSTFDALVIGQSPNGVLIVLVEDED